MVRFWPQLGWRSNNLKSMGFLFSSCLINTLCYMRAIQNWILELLLTQTFQSLTSADLSDLWPPPKTLRPYVPNMGHKHTKCEVNPSFYSWGNVFTSKASQSTHIYKYTPSWLRRYKKMLIETKIYGKI